jgi:hypothetical protein
MVIFYLTYVIPYFFTFAGMGDGWLSPNHLQTFPTQQYQSSLLVQALSHTSKNLKFSSPSSPTNFQGQSLILPKSDLNMKDAQVSENNRVRLVCSFK